MILFWFSLSGFVVFVIVFVPELHHLWVAASAQSLGPLGDMHGAHRGFAPPDA